ncbi:threonine synthase [Pseudomarimonas arenosa]|uniref:Threonine synthase n=1 Tax=Pseudomarimonas arenosa TaxID=2774145 RepID=A0AAW3ZQ38_9GAMM|nr:threonine synthase [Pseudomarimonas arenosa]MBD8527050.1 threonine synthase [Pseudomarimonas arenosa]
MQFVSTRHQSPAVSLSEALTQGLAPDGGLYLPAEWPAASLAWNEPMSVPQAAERLLQPFFAGDQLESALGDICREALDLPAPVVPSRDPHVFLLELFHGPTAAFKDFAARFLAACFARLLRPNAPTLTILVATSGDTGGAVAAAFHRRPGFRVVVLYPDGKVSPRQAHQLAAFGDNVHTFKVAGTFDDCQAMVKQAFADTDLRQQVPLSSANSISLGRLLPQMSYYAAAALRWEQIYQSLANFVIPTGNLGNALACVLARKLGLPIGDILLATNANRVLPEFLDSGDYQPRPSVQTLANAMDVGAPSNLERLRALFPQHSDLTQQVSAASVNDGELRQIMATAESRYGHIVCPHTAAALALIQRRQQAGDQRSYIAVATAHPAKFDSVVEPCIGHPVAVPAALDELLRRPAQAEPLAAEYAELRQRLVQLG